jgi:hypothetical protein
MQKLAISNVLTMNVIEMSMTQCAGDIVKEGKGGKRVEVQ